MTLEELMSIVTNKWLFNESRYDYAGLAGPTEPGRRRFEVTHILLHMVANLGRLGLIWEREDHREARSEWRRELAPLVAKLLADVMRIADVCGMSTAEVEASVRNWATEPN